MRSLHGRQAVLSIIDNLFHSDLRERDHNRRISFHSPNYTFQREQIAFVHLPKTGGTSLNRLFAQDSGKRWANINFHRPISRHCDPRDFSYVTVLRDPVQRVWSYYQMILRSHADYPYKRFADEGLEVFIKKCFEVRNLMCQYYTAKVRSKLGKADAELAYQNLRSFVYVIDFEKYRDDVNRFQERFGLCGKIPHERESAYLPMSEGDKILIENHNELDLKIFQKWKTPE